MSREHLTAALAKGVMGWTVGPDRFLMGNRGWMPRWRFQPTEKLEDAFRLLEEALPQEYIICRQEKSDTIHVLVRIRDVWGEALESSVALTISYAVARAWGIEVDSTS